MVNLNILESLRTKEEVLNYLKNQGKNITEEEIEALKQSYEQAEENNDTLSLKQLDNVAGGIAIIDILKTEHLDLYSYRGLYMDTKPNLVKIDFSGLKEAGYTMFMYSDAKKDGKFELQYLAPSMSPMDSTAGLEVIHVNPDALKECIPKLAKVLNSVNEETQVTIEELKPKRCLLRDMVAENKAMEFIHNGFNGKNSKSFIFHDLNEYEREKIIRDQKTSRACIIM